MPIRTSAWMAAAALFASAPLALAQGGSCSARSGDAVTPVIELYTSEGCSSCPPADQWLSTLKGLPVVAQAFHVAYWDYIGWEDHLMFCAPFAFPFPPTMRFGDILVGVLPGVYGYHPDFAQID